MIYTFHVRSALGIYASGLPPGCFHNRLDSSRFFLPYRLPSRCWSVPRSPTRSGAICCKTCADDHDVSDYLRASIFVPATLAHHRMRMNGVNDVSELVDFGTSYSNDIDANKKRYPFPTKELRHQMPITLGTDFFRRFKSPTIFLRISCDKDYLLPIVVDEYAIEKLVCQLLEYNDGIMLDQYQLAHNVALEIGYKAKMVKIAEKVYNSYAAKLYFCKQGETEDVAVDIRPSDGIVVANLFKASIYIGKELVSRDAIVVSSGIGRSRDSKPAYDVSLDSPCEGLDLLAEELHLVQNMNLAVEEERFKDAAAWSWKLTELRKSKI